MEEGQSRPSFTQYLISFNVMKALVEAVLKWKIIIGEKLYIANISSCLSNAIEYLTFGLYKF